MMRVTKTFKPILFCLTLLYLFVYNVAQAALNLELTQGIDSAVPIAIVPFGGADGSEVSDVVRADLQNSGRFRPIANNQMRQFPAYEREVRYAEWQSLGVDNMVIGSVQQIAGGRYQVSFALLDVFRSGQGNANGSAALLSKEFTVSRAELRPLAHYISDLIFEKLTGEKGIFSTRIAYILVTNKGDKPDKYILEVADYDGHNPRPLLTSSFPLMSPNWSPDGKRIAPQAGSWTSPLREGNCNLTFPSVETIAKICLPRMKSPKIIILPLGAILGEVA
jgi:TolB protein